jgi:hypothetical protein
MVVENRTFLQSTSTFSTHNNTISNVYTMIVRILESEKRH